ncbi:hypothetical protein B0H13DRAFT_1859602 [Mycena leptocephala]|nr:hypothetical protein B0H13DRAFT_1859602 [Mycena leptocephala]
MISIIFGAISHFVILLRIYALWDHREKIARILITAFVLCISTTTILGIFCALHLQYMSAEAAQMVYVDPLKTCAFGTKPKVLIAMLGILSSFDLFLVVITVWNALERPHVTNIEVIGALQTDGLRFFLPFDSPIWFLQYSELIVWALCSVINSELHMRLEGLALPRGPVIMFEDF